jgi:hypothetical protein
VKQPQILQSNIDRYTKQLSVIRDDLSEETHSSQAAAGDTLSRDIGPAVKKEKTGGIENQILKLFPERVIKVSSFIDLLGSQLHEPSTNASSCKNAANNLSSCSSLIRIKNPVKKLASDVDFAVQELVSQLMESNIELKIRKHKDLIYEI